LNPKCQTPKAGDADGKVHVLACGQRRTTGRADGWADAYSAALTLNPRP